MKIQYFKRYSNEFEISCVSNQNDELIFSIEFHSRAANLSRKIYNIGLILESNLYPFEGDVFKRGEKRNSQEIHSNFTAVFSRVKYLEVKNVKREIFYSYVHSTRFVSFYMSLLSISIKILR